MKEKSVVRNSNIELLRILAALGVIVLHYNNAQMGGGFQYVEMNTINAYIMYFLENVFICAVNVFVLISGYFMSSKTKVNTVRAVELVVQVIAFNAGTLLLRIITSGEPVSWKACLVNLLPVNYYVTLYVVVYLLAPFINALLNHLSNAAFKKLVLLIFVLFSVWPTLLESGSILVGGDFGGMNTIGIGGSQSGYTAINFILMYVIGAYLKRLELSKKASSFLWKLVVCWVVQFVCSYVATIKGYGTSTVWAYCNPFVIMTAVYTFMLFNSMKGIKSIWINKLAKASFTVYLLHMLFVSKIGIASFVNRNPFVYVLHVVVSCVLIYAVCYLVYVIYNFFAEKIFRWLEKVVPFPEISCEEK